MSGHYTRAEKDKAVLVAVNTPDVSAETSKEYLEELRFLVDTAGAETIQVFVQRADSPHPKTYVGSGKIDEIKAYIATNEIPLVVFDDELTPSQLKNIEGVLKCKVLDRTTLILDIFAKRARTAQSRTQVELAQYQYMLPRLTRMWTHLERQRGGIGMRGPGETELETDRRIIRDKITLLKKKLEEIDKQNAVQRKRRKELIRVALVGYTNVGKSTLMNVLSKSDIFAENKLFATLDTTVRKVVLNRLPFLLSDTVGFIRKLPHHLVESFKSTLDEVREADILLHVVDVSHPNFEEQISVVDQTLLELGAADKLQIVIFNKVDCYVPAEHATVSVKDPFFIEELRRTWMARSNKLYLFISATQKINMDELKETIFREVYHLHMQRYPNYLPGNNEYYDY